MNKILVIPNKTKDIDYSVSYDVIKRLIKNGCGVFVEDKYGVGLECGATLVKDIPNDIELIVVVGGDGSVIDASMIAVERDVPILGVNLGKLGYLSEVEVTDLERLLHDPDPLRYHRHAIRRLAVLLEDRERDVD